MKYRPEYDSKVIGRNLRRLREARHLSVEYVREYLRLGSVQAVYKYEKGTSYPQTDTMFALMELYGAELKDIVNQEEASASSPFFYQERSKGCEESAAKGREETGRNGQSAA